MMLLSGCLCCCMLSAVTIVVGAFLFAYDNYRDKNGVEIAGAVVLAVGVVMISIAFCLCFATCCYTCAKGGRPFDNSPYSTKDWTLKRLNDQFDREVDVFDDLRYDVGFGSSAFREKRKKERLERAKKKKDNIGLIESELQKDLEAGLSTRKIQNKRRPALFKIVFDGDIYVSTIDTLRDQISICLAAGTKNDTICVVLTSGGGAVTMYGLAAAQLGRVRKAGFNLVVCVDSIAASGGYLMAAMSQRICASPFALVGSIGVISIVPNVQKLLEKHNINTHVFTAGKFKRTVDVVGEVTDEGKRKMIEELEEIHQVFKDHIVVNRPALKDTIDEVATGEAWLAIEGKKKGLVDDIMTSDEFIAKAAKTHDVILLKPKPKRRTIFADDFAAVVSQVAKSKLSESVKPTTVSEPFMV
ncbi:Probable protease SohB [Durusdinium trenchii]|uniref:Probable protease SohB n=1 Tax=Durusdinium trenchii TaxID=1381693 RepID=A0ABP0HHK9_9DINO